MSLVKPKTVDAKLLSFLKTFLRMNDLLDADVVQNEYNNLYDDCYTISKMIGGLVKHFS